MRRLARALSSPVIFIASLRHSRAALLVLALAACNSGEWIADYAQLANGIARLVRFPAPIRPTRGHRHVDPLTTYSVPIDADDPVLGSSDALVTIVEAYDYSCPYCRRARETMKQLRERYGNELRWIGKPLVIHPQFSTASALASCAANRQHDFVHVDSLLWNAAGDHRFDEGQCWLDGACAVSESIAGELALDVSVFRKDLEECLRWLADNDELLASLGADATPTFWINGRVIVGAAPVETFTKLIDEELATAKQRLSAGTTRAGYYETFVVQPGIREAMPM